MSRSDQSPASRGENDMTPEQAAEHLRVIRDLMERPIRNTTRSGLSGIVAGVLALGGCAATWRLADGAPTEPTVALGLVWLGVLVSAAGIDLLLTWRRAAKLGQAYWKRGQRQTALAIAPGFVIGGLMTGLLVRYQGHEFIPFFWMVFYGMAVWSVGLFSVVEVKVLGAAFLAAGVLGLVFWVAHPLAAMAVSFGGFHLLYGAVVWARHGG